MARARSWRKGEIQELFGPIISVRRDPDTQLARAEAAWNQGGEYGAMLAALQVCQVHQLPLPRWLHSAVADFFSAALLQAKSRTLRVSVGGSGSGAQILSTSSVWGSWSMPSITA